MTIPKADVILRGLPYLMALCTLIMPMESKKSRGELLLSNRWLIQV